MASIGQSREISMSQSEFSQYVPTHEYASRTPLQRFDCRYLQLPFEKIKKETIVFGSHDFEDGEFACPGFFDKVPLRLFVGELEFERWRYEMRRDAQQILPFLFLGPSMCVKNYDLLYKEQFTLFLSIRTRMSSQTRLVSGEKAANYLDAEADSIDVLDNQELISVLPRAIRRINDHLSSPCTPKGFEKEIPKKVLVFCDSGNERSAVVVTAYLMAMFNLDAVSALYTVQQRRYCVNIEAPLWNVLCSFETILTAKRDVEKSRRAALASSTGCTLSAVASPRKRGYSDGLGDEIMKDTRDLDEADVVRKPLAPFQDR